MIDKKMCNKAIILGKGAKWAGKETVIRWEEYPQARGEVSLPRIVDDDAKSLKEEYLCWIHNLSSRKFGKETLVQRLAVFLEFQLGGRANWLKRVFGRRLRFMMCCD